MKDLKNILAIAAIVFTALTAILLFLIIWDVEIGRHSMLHGRLIGTAITLAALSFVSYVVVALYGKK